MQETLTAVYRILPSDRIDTFPPPPTHISPAGSILPRGHWLRWTDSIHPWRRRRRYMCHARPDAGDCLGALGWFQSLPRNVTSTISIWTGENYFLRGESNFPSEVNRKTKLQTSQTSQSIFAQVNATNWEIIHRLNKRFDERSESSGEAHNYPSCGLPGSGVFGAVRAYQIMKDKYTNLRITMKITVVAMTTPGHQLLDCPGLLCSGSTHTESRSIDCNKRY